MQFNELVPNFIKQEDLLDKYLKQHNVMDTKKFLRPVAKNLEFNSAYHNIRKAANNFMKHRNKSKKIYILCDVDCDGLFSTALMMDFCTQSLGIAPFLLIHGGTYLKTHGLTDESVLKIIEKDPPDMLIVPDAGSNDVEACRRIKDAGVQTILILDHHTMLEYNKYAYIVNNQNPDNCNIHNTALSGTGVAWKFCDYVNNTFNLGIDTKQYLDLVAFSICSDVCDVTTLENRYILDYGLGHITNTGLKAFCETFTKTLAPTPEEVVWKIVPKLNAVMRFDNIELKGRILRMLSSYCPLKEINDEYSEEYVIKEMKHAHRDQTNLTKEISEKLLEDIDPNSKVSISFVDSDNLAFTGLLASKIAGKTRKPALVIRDIGEQYIGSVRTDNGKFFDLCQDSGLFDFVAGHREGAFGIGFPKKNLEPLKKYFGELDLSYESVYNVIKVLEGKEVSKYIDIFGLTACYKYLWGHGLEKPVFGIRHIFINGKDISPIGKTQSTITFRYGQDNMKFIRFFTSKEDKEKLHVGEDVDLELEIIGTLEINEYNDMITPQVQFTDFEAKIVDRPQLDSLF